VIGGGDARVLQGRELRLEPLEFLPHLGQLVGERERGHDREPGIADLAEAPAQPRDAGVEVLGEAHEMRLLAVLAGHAELAAVDGDVDLRHGVPAQGCGSSALVRREHGADGVDGGIEPLGGLAVGIFQGPRTGGGCIELGGEPGAVGPQRMQLGVERRFAAVGLPPPLDGGCKRVKRKRKTFAGRVDGARFSHPRQHPLARP
jgi:hypothetical protein